MIRSLRPVVALCVGVALFASPSAIYESHPKCVFSDGTTIQDAVCMFEDSFADLSKWRRFIDYEGPTQQVIPAQCFDGIDNVSVASNVAHLLMTVNHRSGTCVPSWDCTTAYYTTNFGTSWPCPLPGGASTDFDMGIMQTLNFKSRFGHYQWKMKAPGGTGVAGEIGLWDDHCMSARGVIGEGNAGFFAHAGGTSCLFPTSFEIDMINVLHSSGNLNTTVYVDNSVGSPGLIGSFAGTNYYGAQWSNQAIGGATKPFLAGNNPPDLSDGAFHQVDVDWDPYFWAVYLDGVQVTYEVPTTRPTWIPTGMAFIVAWIADGATVDPATLPQDMQMKEFKAWCPKHRPCAWVGGL